MNRYCYMVGYSTPSSTGFRKNGWFRAITWDAGRAIDLCRQKHPSCTIWSVQNQGDVHYIDPEPTLPEPLI